MTYRQSLITSLTRRYSHQRSIVKRSRGKSYLSNVLKYTSTQLRYFVSDLDPIETLLSPTLSSFDFDDDSEVMSDDDELFLSSEMRVEQAAIAGTKINVEDTIVSEHSFLPPFRTYFCKREVRTARAKTIGVCERSRHDEHQRSTLDGAEGEARLRGILYRMTYTKSDATDLWATKQNPGRFQKDIARSLFVSMQMRGTHIFEQLIVAGVQFRPDDIDVPDQELSAFWKPSVLSAYPSSVRPLSNFDCEEITSCV